MNILIVGEFSGFAKHLKNGYKKIGHHVTIVMEPDSFKKFHGDNDDILYGINISLFGKSIRGSSHIIAPFRAFWIHWKLNRRYKKACPDVIIIINYGFITESFYKEGTPMKFINKQVERGSKLIMLCCGGDPAFRFMYPELMKIWGYDISPEQLHDNRYSWLLKKSDKIIPMSVTYYDAIINYSRIVFFDVSKVVHSIPPPMTVEIDFDLNPIKDRKIVVFHGIIRPKDKGTCFIKEAMDRIQSEMPDKVVCICKGGMPYDDYVKVFKEVDILIDQTYGRGFGMNALIGAMKGKCVLVSNTEDNINNMGLKTNPFIRIEPDSEQIYSVLYELILNPERIDRLKMESRKFVEENCECSHIAKRYLNVLGIDK